MIHSVQWDTEVVKALSDAYGAAVFLITEQQQNIDCVTLHVTGPGDIRRAQQAAKRFGAARAVVRRHAPDLLATPHSLEKLVGLLLSGQRIVADPTGAVTKAMQLADTAKRARIVMPERIRGLYFNPSHGLVFAWMREPPSAEEARPIMEAVLAEAGADWACVILSPVVPIHGMIAVDEASAKAASAHNNAKRVRRLVTTAAAAIGVTGALTAAGAAQSAVFPSDDPLFQAAFKAGGGSIDKQGYGLGEGSVGIYGAGFAQIDLAGISANGLSDGGGALQAGFRDPAHYRAGVFVAQGSAGSNFTMGGGFADFFIGPLNLRLTGREVSVQHGPNKFFLGGGADYYIDDNTKIYVDVNGDSTDTLGQGGIEHAFQGLSGLAVGGAGTFGPGEGGFKIYAKWWFGGSDETLKHHDRSGPAGSVLDDLWFAEATRLGAKKGGAYGGGGGVVSGGGGTT